METVLITGGTGLIGTALTDLLATQGYEVILLSRKPGKQSGKQYKYALWDVEKGKIDQAAVAAADHIIHLAGANVGDKRWTDKRKKEIVDSRVESGRLLATSLKGIPNKVRSFLSASATGWYGPDPSSPARPFIESDPPAKDFLGETCRLWEESVQPVRELGKRLVTIRTSIVLSNEGGALPQLIKSVPFGVATILGSGKQMISWIHIDDIARVYLEAIRNDRMNGPYNAAAPENISNKEFVLRAARILKKSFLPVHIPEFAIKLALGEMSTEVMKSTTVSDTQIRDAGFKFIYPGVDAALNHLLRQR